MDNINIVVLIVALVFVAAGVVLIALSAIVGRGTPASAGVTEPPEPPVDRPADQEDDVLFIDEPLTTDLADELAEPERGRRPTGLEAEAPAEAAAVAEVETPAGQPGEIAAATGASARSAAVAEPAGATEALPATVLTGDSHESSVRRGFEYLEDGLVSEAAAEFRKAAALTDDRAVKVSLYTRIGDALREQGMNGPACASYLQATAYSDDPDERARLERAIAEMPDTEPTAGDGSGSSSDQEE